MKQVTCRIKNGTAEIEVNGVKGTACAELTASFETALAGATVSHAEKPEMQERPLTQEQDVRQAN